MLPTLDDMVEIEILSMSDDIGMRIHGHANSADLGKDTVCAAASMLAYTMAAVAQQLQQDGCLDKPPIIYLDHGEAEIHMAPRAIHMDKVYNMAQAVALGAQCLAANFPAFVRVI